jgi:anti-sigma factor RsiW
MTCKELTNKLDDYVDGTLTAADTETLDHHIVQCAVCRDAIAQERQLRGALQDYGKLTAPQPDAAFFDQALATAAWQGARRQRNRWFMSGVAGTLAAGVLVWLLAGTVPTGPALPEVTIPAIAMTLEEPRRVNLKFSSAAALADATMTVVLPPGIEVQGFAGQREITWKTSLLAGNNVLPLTLIATSPQGGELMATLRHSGDDKTFRVRVNII